MIELWRVELKFYWAALMLFVAMSPRLLWRYRMHIAVPVVKALGEAYREVVRIELAKLYTANAVRKAAR